ncbi:MULTISPECIES: protein translocase subunit SecD [Carboxydothermus]|uniref:Protein translocase subunit SecD n=2 Tax=Carboxydothermus TaxID=129957 RepID=Q3ABZ0_CARHZ|nr:MULTISPECIES: protein translocase subunit SecD [Carboxydothermus]ABB15523.1 protein-export membrane protein SecD [Carboxydothermus hydrogenoformans Z-2901]NYE58283.1 preprotein translocase subunit SecD [Carboxydothermus ferrireducens DSM 11255]
MRLGKFTLFSGVLILILILGWYTFLGFGAVKPLVKYTTLGLDLQGGVHVVFQAKELPGSPVNDKTMQSTISIIETRVNELGISEPIIQKQGKDRIIVEIAGYKNPEEAVRTLIKPAVLEFKSPEGEVIVSGKDLRDAIEAKDPNTGLAEVDLTFNAEGAKKFADFTTKNVNRNLGIYLDGKLLQNPVIKEPITNGKARITGYKDLEEAHRIAVLLRSGALPLKLEILEKKVVGPTLGADSLRRSVRASIIGVIAIFVFMILYYRFPGFIADFALILYATIVLGVMIALKATLTLPGIAGFVLSMGMAVDANILIFERLKEELRMGKTLRSAIDAGFKRAFLTVFDSNATTLIAAVILYFLGTGPIRGFAVTLSIGIIASMFTAITFTRWLLFLAADSKVVKNPKLYGA